MSIIRSLRRMFDAKAEFVAEQVIAPDKAVILQWKAGALKRAGLTRKERANVAHLRIEREKRKQRESQESSKAVGASQLAG